MSHDVSLAVVTAVLGAVSASIAALLAAAVKARQDVDEGLRATRLDVYPALWLDTGFAPRWPRAEVTYAGLATLHTTFRTWYYSTGGLYLSEDARARYGDVQELIAAMLTADADRPADRWITGDAYDDLQETLSDLRTALTQDLETRRKRSSIESLRRQRWHKQAGANAEDRIARAGSREPDSTA